MRHGDARPFRVGALGGVTQDVGTAFAVSRGDEAVTVGVTQGTVRVTGATAGASLELHALGKARYEQGGALQRLAAGSQTSIAAWRYGLIVIDGKTVDQAIAEVARYRPGLTLSLADTSAQPKVSGVFRTDALEEALRTLAQMADLRITNLPGGIAVLRR